ncbi:hypothetical protein EJB05_04754, partial [Eragrostis curvula]
MEDLSDLGGGGRRGAARPPHPPLLPSSKVSVQVYTVPSSTPGHGAGVQVVAPFRSGIDNLVPPLLEDDGDRHAGRLVDQDPVKAKIVGLPPEAAEEIAAAAKEKEARQRAAVGDAHAVPDPELDQFMESYCELVAAWKEELSRPLREAKEFLRTVELQLSSISAGSSLGALISSEEKSGIGSFDDDQEEGNGMEAEEVLCIDPCSDDKELKRQLLNKYGGYLGNLRKELCKKRKKGKLPKEARQKLLSWWELHYRWPYPSEMEKIALAEATGLEQKQINNWFINQRKRPWKPSEEMQFTVMDGFLPAPQNAALYVDARVVGTTPAMIFARPEHGAHALWHS